jgi:hypothetical protein
MTQLEGLRSLKSLVGTAIILAMTVYALRAGRSIGPLTSVALLLLLCVDLGIHNVRNRYYGGSSEVRKLYDAVDLPLDGVSASAPILNRVHGLVRTGVIPERAEILGVAAMINTVGVHGVPMTAGYNPMVSSPYAAAFGGASNVQRPSDRIFTELAPRYDSPAFDLLGLRVVVSRDPLEGALASDGVHWKLRQSVLPRVLNPVSVRGHSGTLPPAGAFQETDFRKDVWLSESELAVASCPRHDGGVATLEPISYGPNRVEIAYHAERPAWIVLNEIDAPGWWAEVNGQEVPLLRANALFRGVCVPVGPGHLTFHFSPLRMVELRWRARPAPRSRDTVAAASAIGTAD